MIGREFYDRVNAHADMEWIGAIEGKDSIDGEAIVCHIKTGVKHAVSVRAVLDTEWPELEAVITGARYAKLMVHRTRIVGYYSRVENWNGSKLAELRDRQAGAKAGGYAVGGRAMEVAVLPDEVAAMVASVRADDMVCDMSKGRLNKDRASV
jgi:hypothetical protein